MATIHIGNAVEAVFRAVDREIWLITAAAGGRRSGLIATCVMQSSLDAGRSRIMVGLTPGHYTAELVDASKAFCLHLLASSQVDLVWQFGMFSGRGKDKFADVDCEVGANGATRLRSCLAAIDCRVVDRFDAGDRIWVWAEVESVTSVRPGSALTEQQLLAAANDEQRTQLRANLLADSELQMARFAEWRTNHPAIR